MFSSQAGKNRSQRFSVVTVAVVLMLGLLPAQARALDLAGLLQSLTGGLTPGPGALATPSVVPAPTEMIPRFPRAQAPASGLSIL